MTSRGPLLITGATGTLGRAFARLCELRGLSYVLTSRSKMDITDRASVERCLQSVRPWAIINTAGWVRVDDAEDDPEACFRENAFGAALLASSAADRGIRCVVFSTDLVFNGDKRSPYMESDLPQPINAYGASKARAEELVRKAHPGAMIVRTSAFFGPWDDANWVTSSLRALRSGDEALLPDDAIIAPTYVPDLVQATLDLLIDDESGLWHLANPGEITWLDLVREAARATGVPTGRLSGQPTEAFQFRAPRPLYSALLSRRATLLPPLSSAIARYAVDSAAKAVDNAA
jgi:dTDP-4-dehydrorhamnose reductase